MTQAKNELHKDYYFSPLGLLAMVSDGESLVRLDFMRDAEKGESDLVADAVFCGGCATEVNKEADDANDVNYVNDVKYANDAVLAKTKQWLDEYFAGHCPDFTPPLKPQGTPFQELVWQLLLDIPYGATTTYGELAQAVAQRLGKERMSAQAVGQAVGRNPIAIIIPCHRVVGSKGQLTGYAGGLERKRALLELEQSGAKSDV
ncbi:MAG: methylated-DNA--[protein]-cysteine S-methyltransferase [Phascolarctobacterium sp.]